MELLHFRLGHAPTREKLKEFFAMGEWVSPRVFIPASVTTLVTGIGLVITGKPMFSDFVIVYALVAIVCAMLFGAIGIGSNIGKLAQIVNEPSINMEAFKKYSRRVRFATNVDLAILISIVFDVVTEPKWDSYPFFIITAVFLVGTVLYNVLVTPEMRVE
jgi:hypothetical protein